MFEYLVKFIADILFGTFEDVRGIAQELPLRHVQLAAERPHLVAFSRFIMLPDMGFYILHKLPAFVVYLGIRHL